MHTVALATIHWTRHAQEKMRFYGLSEQRVKRVLRSPQRIEEGIAPNTIAVMQKAGSRKHPYEVWAMVQRQRAKTKNNNSGKVKIITAWKYPGESPLRNPIPENVLRELNELL